jgi:MoaA/NifB/PqqE/SkfB family radical SAM enzyme
MNIKRSQTYCKLSHVSLAVQNEGDVCVCNKNTQSFEDGKRNKLYLHEVGLERMWRSPTRRLVTAGLDHGKRIPSCQACWNDEDAGIKSTRQIFNEILETLEPLTDQPRIFILKPTNACNMGCRTCQPSTSTTLYQDFYKLDTELKNFDGSLKDYTGQFESIRLGLGKQNLAMWDTFRKWIPGLVFLDVYGGEPMLAPAMWDELLQADVSNTKIQFHTNGTIWNQEYADLLHKFKQVQISVSIDSHIPEQLKYIRHKVDVDQLYINLKKYIDLSHRYSNILVNICFTVSIYNIWYADQITTELSKFKIPVTVNVVYGPEQYDMRHLPLEIKKLLADRLATNEHCQNLVGLLTHVIPGCDIWWPKFWQEVQVLDQIRSQSFAEVFPEYYQAILPYLPNESS